jgi:hypothetical protein
LGESAGCGALFHQGTARDLLRELIQSAQGLRGVPRVEELLRAAQTGDLELHVSRAKMW